MDIEFQPPGLIPDDLPQPPTPRDLLLEAAERSLEKRGVAGLAAGSVASEAGVPRQAVLFHFPDRTTLVAALLGRTLDRFESAQDQLAADDWEARGRWSRAYLRCAAGESGEDFGQEIAGLFEAGADRSALRSQLLDRVGRWQERIGRDGLEPAVATLVRWAADGLWLSLAVSAEAPADPSTNEAPVPDPRRRALAMLRRLTLRAAKRTAPAAPAD